MHDPVFARSLWSATAPAAPATTPLRGEVQADVAVIGGGYLGLSCALHLAEGGAKAVVLEGAEVGFGASGRNNGQVIPTLSRVDPDALPAMVPAAAGGTAKGEQLVQLVADSAAFTFDLIRRHAIDCEAVQHGWVQPAHTPGRVALAQRRVDAWARRGAPVELLDAQGVQAVTGSAYWYGGWLNRSGGKLNPLAYVRGLARAAMQAGATVHTGSPALAVERDGSGWRVRTAAGSVRAPRVVIATHAYGEQFGAGLWPRLARSVVPVRSYQMATPIYDAARRASVLPQDHACSDTRGDLHFFRWDAHGRLVTGGALALAFGWQTRLPALIAERVERVFPQLGRPRFEHVWHGYVGITADGLPHCHEPAPGVLAFVGCNGRGVALTTVVGREFARACLGTPLAELPMPFTPIRAVRGHAIGKRVASLALLGYRRRDAREPA